MEDTYTYYFTASSEQLDEVPWTPLSPSLGHTAHRALAVSLSERAELGPSHLTDAKLALRQPTLPTTDSWC